MTTATAVRDTGMTQGHTWDVSQRGDKQNVALWCHRDMDQGLAQRKRGEPLRTDLSGKPVRAYYYPAYLNQVALKFGWYPWPLDDCLTHKFVPMFDVKDSTGRVIRKRGTPEFGCPDCRLAGDKPKTVKVEAVAEISVSTKALISVPCFRKMCGEVLTGKDGASVSAALRRHLSTHPALPSKKGKPKKGGSVDQPAEIKQ